MRGFILLLVFLLCRCMHSTLSSSINLQEEELKPLYIYVQVHAVTSIIHLSRLPARHIPGTFILNDASFVTSPLSLHHNNNNIFVCFSHHHTNLMMVRVCGSLIQPTQWGFFRGCIYNLFHFSENFVAKIHFRFSERAKRMQCSFFHFNESMRRSKKFIEIEWNTVMGQLLFQ